MKPRTYLAERATRLAERWTGRKLLAFDHPPAELGPRYGHGRPPHRRLIELLAGHEDAYRVNLETIASSREPLARIERSLAGGSNLAGVDRRGFAMWLTTT